MKKSEERGGSPLSRFGVRSRVFLYFLIFTAVLLVLLYVFQIVMLDSFYRTQKTQMLLNSAELLAANIDNAELQALSDQLCQTNGVCVLILDENGETVASSEASPGCVIHRMNETDVERYIDGMKDSTETLCHAFSVGSFGKEKFNPKSFDGHVPEMDSSHAKSMIAMKGVELADGGRRYVFLNAIVTPVNATVQTLKSQYVVIALLMVMLSFLLSLILSRRIANPIIATNEAAKALSKGEYRPAVTRVTYREIRQLNATLTEAAKELRRVEEMQRELIANISHDLRTPLTMIGGYAEVMRDLPGENTPENMQIIIDETKRLSSLVNTVLEYTKSKSDNGSLNCAEFDLTQSIEGIMTRYAKLIEQDGYRIVFKPEKHVTVNADELKVGQVVYNLVNNALTYTGEDRTVTIRQESRGEGVVRISVSDSGEGIDAEELPQIWSRYYRGQKPHKRATVGSGLGLSIVQGILDAHGLPYGVESTVGVGTTFWFEVMQA